MRRIKLRIKDINETYQELEETLKINKISYDGLLISLDTKTAYLWENKRPNNQEPKPIKA